MSDPEFIAELLRTRDEYQTNAEKAVGLGEYRKASELLWGALTQQLKALAATREVVITSHRQFFDFLRQFAHERAESYLYEEFVELNALHKNFYDEIIPLDTFPRMYERAIRFIGRLQNLVAEVA